MASSSPAAGNAEAIAPGLHRERRALEGRAWPVRWFSLDELACRCGVHCRGEYFHDPAFLQKLDALRDAFGAPLRVNSGRRCARHNTAVGGASRSRHKLAIAVDLDVSRFKAAERRRLLAEVRRTGFGGIGYGRGFLHLDGRPRPSGAGPAEWDYQPGGMAAWKALLNA